MIIIGIDPALRCTGYGVIVAKDSPERKTIHALDCGIIKNAASLPISTCLARLAAGIDELSSRFAPDVVAIEGGFYLNNAKTAMVLGMARGSIVSRFSVQQIPVYEYAPRRVKQMVIGSGKASKHSIAVLMANTLDLKLKDLPNDASDALAIALCHHLSMKSMGGIYRSKPI